MTALQWNRGHVQESWLCIKKGDSQKAKAQKLVQAKEVIKVTKAPKAMNVEKAMRAKKVTKSKKAMKKRRVVRVPFSFVRRRLIGKQCVPWLPEEKKAGAVVAAAEAVLELEAARWLFEAGQGHQALTTTAESDYHHIVAGAAAAAAASRGCG